MIEAMRQSVREALVKAKNPALLCSFGKDSLLLLRLLRDEGFNGAIYYLGEELSELAKAVIVRDGLTVYSWPPINRYVVPEGEEFMQVDEFLLGNVALPVLTPIKEGDDCAHGRFQRYAKPFHFPHDVTFTGYKQGETFEAVGMDFPMEFDIHITRFISPLFEFSDEQVFEALDHLGITYERDNAVEFCNECMNAIINDQWDRQATLTAFRSRFSFNH